MADAEGELAGKTAIVTGGTRGIGRGIAAAFARAGANVAITGLNAERGAAAARALAPSVLYVAADQGSDEDWQRVVAAALDRFGRVDILVINAGLSFRVPTAEMSLEDFRKLNRVNLKGAFLGLKHATIAMRRHGEGGSIVLIASIVGLVGAPGFMHYTASKGGLRLMAKAAALELGPEKIRVNSVHPGFVRTDLGAMFDEKQFAPMIPLKRFAEPRDIAQAALFLAGPRSKFVTGSELVVDGGLTAQ